MKPDKFELYELAVQSPRQHVQWLDEIYMELRGRKAVHLREDFCGTYKTAVEWVLRDPYHTAVGLDLDPEPLAYGKRKHEADLTLRQKRRLRTFRRNVLSVTSPLADLLIAGNFSFYIFKRRALLLRYFRNCLESLEKDGFLVLEMAGGPGMIEEVRERRVLRRRGSRLATYVWDQQSFDPITHDARYAIHFLLPGGGELKDAFVYDWRLWTIPEVRDALEEAGFGETFVYWETEHEGQGTGEYLRMDKGDNAYSWVAYVIASRTPIKQKRRPGVPGRRS